MILLNVEGEIMLIVNRYLNRVKKSGPNNIMAICPFHRKLDGTEEKTPSFAMNVSNGLYFCHACQSKGNLYTFLRDLGINRQVITNQYGVVIEAAANNIPPKHDPLKPKLEELDPLPEAFLGIFDYCPVTLLQAGFEEATLRHFDIGFDRDHNRITFPLRDFQGRLAGISGRDVTDTGARYKVYDKEYRKWGYPERPEPDKRKMLWNIHTIYPAMYLDSTAHDLYIVEGFKACMWLWQAGIRNVVALLGTYLSDEQRQIVERLGATIHLFLDLNDAGIRGTDKTIARLAQSRPVRVVEYPARYANDPTATAQPDNLSSQEVLEVCSRSIDYVTWRYGLPTSINSKDNQHGIR
jgi:DNA primase